VESIRKVIIIGSGSAGLTAAVYAARANLNPLVITGFAWGGQLMLTSAVENFPGFPEGIMGPELMEKMRQQAERFGAEFLDRDISAVDFSSNPFKITVGEETFLAESVILATGASPKWLGLESERRLIGRGVSSCATCDAPLFKGKDVVVVGGGDTAMEDALFLSKFASSVTVIHRRDKLRASKIMQERAFRNPKIKFIWNSVVKEITGEKTVDSSIIENTFTGVTSRIKCDGVFVAIGYQPNTGTFAGQIELDRKGYIITRNRTETNVEGVFAAGDVHDHRYRQAVTAAASGCEAAMDVEKYLEGKEDQVRASLALKTPDSN